MNLSTMSYEVVDRVAHIRFTRPEAANSVTPAFARDLRQAMLAVESDDEVRAVSVTAEGKVFCAGGDLKVFHAAGSEVAAMAADMLVDFHGAIYKMNRIPKPVVAGIRGSAGGAGLSLVGSFDLVVASSAAKFTMSYTRGGMTPDGTSSYFLARHIGLRRMLDLTLTNRVLSAEEAEAWGLVNRVVEDGEVDAAIAELAQQLADGPWAMGLAKRVIYQGFDSPLEQAGEMEAESIFRAMTSADGQEGIAAFAEKRAPDFTGR